MLSIVFRFLVVPSLTKLLIYYNGSKPILLGNYRPKTPQREAIFKELGDEDIVCCSKCAEGIFVLFQQTTVKKPEPKEAVMPDIIVF